MRWQNSARLEAPRVSSFFKAQLFAATIRSPCARLDYSSKAVMPCNACLSNKARRLLAQGAKASGENAPTHGLEGALSLQRMDYPSVLGDL
jgi:hypothetical protein